MWGRRARRRQAFRKRLFRPVRAARRGSPPRGARARAGPRLQLQILAEPLGLRAADRDFRRLAVLHPEDVIPAEPGDYLLDLVDVDEVRPVHSPEDIGVERGL